MLQGQLIKNSILITSFLILSAVIAASAHATSVSFLRGHGYRDDQGYATQRSTMTLEHFGLWKYGTVFFYYDITDPFSGDNKEGSNQFFGGISPTFSLSKMTGRNFSLGMVRDVSVRVELENGSANGGGRFRNYFYGFQADLSVPGFDFVSVNVVARDNPKDDGVGIQYGGFWQMSWDYGQYSKYKFTGFFAWAPHDGDLAKDDDYGEPRGTFFMSQPQFLYDLGNTWGEPNAVEVGIEYLYAVNRFQAKGKDEKLVQAILKMSF